MKVATLEPFPAFCRRTCPSTSYWPVSSFPFPVSSFSPLSPLSEELSQSRFTRSLAIASEPPTNAISGA